MRSAVTENILTIFNELNKIPRCSKNEAGVCAWLVGIAKENGFEYRVDEAGNLVIRVPATSDYENAPIVVLQGHMDMVCEKTDDSTHDFTKDPIVSIEKDDWLYGNNTTLGADNGIAIAMALAVALDPAVEHPKLELLFTVSEEIGLWGVKDLPADFIEGRAVINIDSEQEGTFVVGSAGGVTYEIGIPMEASERVFDKSFSLKVSGCRGGHSGVDVHKHFANAIKLLTRTLNRIAKISDLQLHDIKGGTAHNAIPRGAEAIVSLPSEDWAEAMEVISQCEQDFRGEHKGIDPNIQLIVTDTNVEGGYSPESSLNLINALNAYPHGISDMSASIAGFVETSNNLASVKLNGEKADITTSQRSVSMSKLEEITDRIFSITELAGGRAVVESDYVSWEPNMGSRLLGVAKSAYTGLFHREPIVEMIHAGLECSVIGDIFPGSDILSIGVTIENPHSPTERMYLPSIDKVWNLLVAILAAYKS